MADKEAPETASKPVETEKPPAVSVPEATEPSEVATEPATEANTAPQPATSTTEPGLLSGEHWTQMPEGNEDDEDANSIAGSNASSTESMSSTILNYRMIRGRRYHSERGNAQYWVSNDEQSNEALDINHHVMTLILGGKLHVAPLPSDVQTVVDIGTGTGIWAIDFADEYPGAKVIGTEISPIQPSWIPPNLEFQIDDCTQDWTFKENSLDFVHMRFLVGSIVDWPALFKQAYRCLKPGGYIESHEATPEIGTDDGTIPADSAMGQWGKVFFEGGRKLGRTFAVLEDEIQRKGMEEAGFVDIVEKDYKVPIGGWPKDPTLSEAGQYFQAAILEDVEGTLTFICSLLGWSKEEAAVFAAHYRREVKSKKIHAYFSQRVVYAKKPLDA